ncbi:proline iminopeptidase (plasmid) [Legionella adelaidensis]|uniref:Proline iminopeptidase n=1 Tax=Legionella adelaidensis TaxID=45056 RepID=A0A0W0R3E0_9GAMM|nr:prolyl aminopeptidase [Legionella adelaidensis]KTC65559.1 proline iminopeptidase [Legionella adelaidensis]VEH84620.1 proline iminopeptidase [Legionella adelaidensis]
MLTLYPAIKPNVSHIFSVTKPHVLYLEESGNPNGIPIIALHSGPGAGGDTHLRRFFDPQRYRIIIFDQRGCGRSTPHLELANNTTQDLIDDIEAVRHFLGLNRFILFGGGWGSLLALLYAEQYPQNVNALLLHQILLGRKDDIDWFYQGGAAKIYPDYWQDFIKTIPGNRQNNITGYFNECLQGTNDLARISAAKTWATWQAHCSSLQPNLNVIDAYNDPHFALTLATLESHYVSNQYFIKENQVLENIKKIRHIPTYLIHGRYNMVCPLSAAWQLHESMPASHLSIVRDAGHSDREPGLIDAIIHASIEILRQDLDAS